ncbi:MAG: dTDP-4-dehydrorhamnose reductase [Parcubacteria group bacterium GW2011_GWA2_47_10b]|nr:MAG: dTDP-4-dehydrorhamnose reductase [Parcubacteria group bacterium GW2011_GWA2_47_10b]
MKIFICGGAGQLASEFADFFKTHHPEDAVRAPTYEELDVTKSKEVQAEIADFRPDLVINTAAYHKVDECETQIERTFLVNAFGGFVVANAAREAGAKSMYISTGFVFDGSKSVPYEESDSPNPLSIYAHSKALAEKLILACDPAAWIVRTNGLFGRFSGKHTKGGAGNFIDFVLTKAQSGEDLDMVADQRITPTFTADLVPACVALALEQAPGGIYHLTNSGETSWFEVAKKIYEIAGAEGTVRPITSEQRNAPARRPKNALLTNIKRPVLPRWEDALTRYLAGRL